MPKRIVGIRLKVRQVLEKKGWTQKELAKKSNSREATISDLANDNKKSINKEAIVRVANALGVEDINDLIEFDWADVYED